VMETIKRSIHR
jgi:helix-turn-helix protein